MKLFCLAAFLLLSTPAQAANPDVYEKLVQDAFLMRDAIGGSGTTQDGQPCTFTAETPDNGDLSAYLRIDLTAGLRRFFLYIFEDLEMSVIEVSLPGGAYHRQYSSGGKVFFSVVNEPGHKRAFVEAEPAIECGVRL